MFQFRLLLLLVGICGVILGTDSITYPTPPAYQEAPPSYGYGYQHQPSYAPAYSPPSYGSYGKGYGYGSSYSANCEYIKVIEVLDQIFCQHSYKQRYSSTIYTTIDMIIEQLEWTYQLVFIQDVYDFIVAAIHELKTLQDAVYNNYGDSSLLEPYDQFYDGGGQSQSSGTSSTRVSTKTRVAEKLTSMNEKLKDFETKSTDFKTRQNINFQHLKTSSQVQQLLEETKTETVADDVNDNRKRNVNKSLLAKARQSRSAYVSSRKTRGADYNDYTCSYLAPIYCSEDKYDELLYNILDRIYTSWDFLYEALIITWEFMDQIDCGASFDDREAFQEAAITFGALLTSFYTLDELARDVERMYEIMELDYGYDSGSYYRAGGGDSSYSSASGDNIYAYGGGDNIYTSGGADSSFAFSQQSSSYPNRPSPPYYNKPPVVPSYPYSGFDPNPQPYRYQRSVGVTPAVPHVFLFG